MAINSHKIFSFSEFSLHTEKRMIFWRDDEEVSMENKPFEVLVLLLENNNMLLSTEEILEQVWKDQFVEPGAVATCIRKIRRTLSQYADDVSFIRNIHGKGYFFDGNVEFHNFTSESEQVIFEFPEELKIACEQYLLYFARFLKDLGINAVSTLIDEAGKVLFSVTPTDDMDALDKIREALTIYLNLPASPIIYGDSFAMSRLRDQVENLRHSQKMVAMELHINRNLFSETVREKDAIILEKDLLIEQQRKFLERITNPSVMMESLEKKEDLEEIFDGLKIGESKLLKEHFGVHLNLAKLLKSIGRRVVGSEQELSILKGDKDN
jgi:DNA-binding winged helix-turn-helix (wHTH) protein